MGKLGRKGFFNTMLYGLVSPSTTESAIVVTLKQQLKWSKRILGVLSRMLTYEHETIKINSNYLTVRLVVGSWTSKVLLIDKLTSVIDFINTLLSGPGQFCENRS